MVSNKMYTINFSITFGKIKEDFPELIDEIPEKHGIKWKHLSVFIQNNDHVVYELRKKYRILGASVRLIARISSRIEGSSSKGRITLRQNVLSTSVRFKKSSAAGLLAAVVAMSSWLGEASAEAQKAERILSIGGSVTEIVYAFGEEDRLVARDTTSTPPPTLRPPTTNPPPPPPHIFFF